MGFPSASTRRPASNKAISTASPAEDAAATDLRRWFSKDQTDIRDDIRVTEEVLAFITEAGAKSVVMTDRIIGCSHEEGIGYEGATCLACPFWAGRDRWTGERLH